MCSKIDDDLVARYLYTKLLRRRAAGAITETRGRLSVCSLGAVGEWL